MSLEAIYLRLPIALQNLGCTLEGLRIQQKRYGAGFQHHLLEAEKRAFVSQEQIEEFRDQRIRAFVAHCANTVPYYRRLFRELRIKVEDIRGFEDLQRLPILTKREVQDHAAEFVPEGVDRRACDLVHTSGTTGGGLRFLATRSALDEQWAIWWRYRRWHGISLDTRCAYFGGRSLVPAEQTKPPFWRTNYAGKQLFFSAYHLTPANLKLYADKLREARIPWLHGYPSLLALLAAYIVDTAFDLGYQPNWITLGAENLLSQQSVLIHRAFGTKPIQHYGMAEGVANVSECEQGMLHVDEDFAGTEFLPMKDGGFRVIGTNFTNLATPLLRYDAQDVVQLGSPKCSCGKPGRLIESIDGRHEDYVVLKGGARVGRLDHVFKDMTRIREAQIVQKEPGKILVRIVRGLNYNEDEEQQLRRELEKRIGSATRVEISYVDEVQRTGRGKLRFVVSELEEHRLERVAGGH